MWVLARVATKYGKVDYIRVSDETYDGANVQISKKFEGLKIGTYLVLGIEIKETGRREILSITAYDEDKHDKLFESKATKEEDIPMSEGVGVLVLGDGEITGYKKAKILSAFNDHYTAPGDSTVILDTHRFVSEGAQIEMSRIDDISSLAEKLAEVDVSIRIVSPTGAKSSGDDETKEEVKAEKYALKEGLDGYYIPDDFSSVASAAFQMMTADSGYSPKVLMVGPTGTGKTTLPQLFAKMTGMKIHIQSCPIVTEIEEWFGFREARDGSTHFVKTDLTKLLEEGNVVVVLDELNRAAPEIANALFSLLDDRRFVVVHGEKIQLGENVIFFATINVGLEYSGTYMLDHALSNRFGYVVSLDHMPKDKEAEILSARTGIENREAAAIVGILSRLRGLDVGVDLSVRTSLEVARLMVSGLDLRVALQYAVIHKKMDDKDGPEIRTLIDEINSRVGEFRSPGKDKSIFYEKVA